MSSKCEQDTILEDLELPPSNLELLAECQELNRGLDLLSNDDPFSLNSEATVSNSGASGTSTPAMQVTETSSTYSMSPPPSLLQPIRLKPLAETPDSEANPWDNVPDQPKSPKMMEAIISIQQSSIPPNSLTSTTSDHWLSSASSSTNSRTFNFDFTNHVPSSGPQHMLSVGAHIKSSNGTSSGFNSPTSTNSSSGQQNVETWQTSIHNSILEDPFDAEWAAIATRNSSVMEERKHRPSSTNPFLQNEDIPTPIKAFELQL